MRPQRRVGILAHLRKKAISYWSQTAYINTSKQDACSTPGAGRGWGRPLYFQSFRARLLYSVAQTILSVCLEAVYFPSCLRVKHVLDIPISPKRAGCPTLLSNAIGSFPCVRCVRWLKSRLPSDPIRENSRPSRLKKPFAFPPFSVVLISIEPHHQGASSFFAHTLLQCWFNRTDETDSPAPPPHLCLCSIPRLSIAQPWHLKLRPLRAELEHRVVSELERGISKQPPKRVDSRS